MIVQDKWRKQNKELGDSTSILNLNDKNNSYNCLGQVRTDEEQYETKQGATLCNLQKEKGEGKAEEA